MIRGSFPGPLGPAGHCVLRAFCKFRDFRGGTTTTMKLLDDLPAFDMAAVPAFYASEAANARNAGVELPANLKHPRQSLKREMLHLLNVANAAKYIERLPEPSETIHAIMRGNYHAWDLVPAVLKLAAPATIEYLGVATLGFNRSNAQELVELLDAGKVRRVDFICSCYFRSTSGDEFAFLHHQLAARRQRVVAIRSHAKVVLFELSDGRRLVIESSANLRSCSNLEQFALTHDAELLAFHKSWICTLIDKANDDDARKRKKRRNTQTGDGARRDRKHRMEAAA